MKALVESKRAFLSNYCPKEIGWTSKEEIEQVASELGLADLSKEQLFHLRNEIVSMYSGMLEQEIIFDKNGDFAGRTPKFWNLNEAMMSVTAVIDEYKLKAGYSVHEI